MGKVSKASAGDYFGVCALGVLVLAAFLAYANTLSGEFVWDDVSSILLHKDVQDPGRFAELFKKDLHYYGRGQGNFYRPLLAATFMVDFALSKPSIPQEDAADPNAVPKVSPFLFHVSSTLWHLAAGLLLFALLTRLEAPRFVRLVVPLLFIVHPLQTEAVAYISGRADQMAGALMFAGLWFALWEGTTLKRAAGTLLSVLCFIAALLSKEAAFIFPALLLLCILMAPERRATTADVGEGVANAPKRPFVPGRFLSLGLSAIVLGVYAWLRSTVLDFGSETASRNVGIGQRLSEAMQAFALYIRLLFVPTHLHMERTLAGVPTWAAAVGVLLLVLCVALVVWGLVTHRYRVAGGMAWFLATWVPISGIFPLNAPMAEHWMYVPLAGFIWALAELVSPLCASKKLRYVAFVGAYGAAMFFLVLTIERNWDWRSNEALYLATLKENPNTSRIHYNLAVTYEDIKHNLPGARRHYERVLELYAQRKAAESQGAAGEQFWDEELESHMSLGRIAMETQDFQSAMQHFSVFLRLQPNDTNRGDIGTAYFGMGRCFLSMGDIQRAQQCLMKAAELRPDLKDAVQQMVGGFARAGIS